MPSKQKFCWCFGGRPPDIKFNVDDSIQLKPVTLDIPMPEEQVVNMKFEELVVGDIFSMSMSSSGHL